MTTFTAAVAASADDAQETSGVMNLTGTTLNANATTQVCGMRFTGVTIPRGATITAASLDLALPSGSYDDPDVTLRGEAADNAVAFTTTANDIANRSKTTAAATWQATGLGTGTKTTPDLSAIVTEITGRAGWSSGNALAIFIQGNSSSSALRWSATDGGSSPAALNVTYTVAGGAAVRAGHYRGLLTG